jgi:hypothetical protein
MTDEQKHAVEHAQKVLRAVKLYSHAELLSASKPAAPAEKAIPDGWRLVPCVATPEMVNAVRAGKLEPASPFHVQRAIETIKSNYLKMLAAVPAEPAEWPDAKARAVAQSDEQGERKAFEAWWDNAIGLYDRKDLAWHAWLAAKNS